MLEGEPATFASDVYSFVSGRQEQCHLVEALRGGQYTREAATLIVSRLHITQGVVLWELLTWEIPFAAENHWQVHTSTPAVHAEHYHLSWSVLRPNLLTAAFCPSCAVDQICDTRWAAAHPRPGGVAWRGKRGVPGAGHIHYSHSALLGTAAGGAATLRGNQCSAQVFAGGSPKLCAPAKNAR